MAIRAGTTAHDRGGIRVSTTAHATWFDWQTLPTVNVAGSYYYGVTGEVTSSGTIYAVAVTTDKPDPSAAQIKDGQDGNGDAAAGTGSETTASTFSFFVTGTNLSDNPDHHVHVVAWDGSEYTSVVSLRNEILFVDDPTYYNPGSVWNVDPDAQIADSFEEGQKAGFIADPWDALLSFSIAPSVATGTYTQAVYSQAVFKQDMFAAETGTAMILLMTLTHPDWDAPVRVSTDPTARLDETTTEILYGTLSQGDNFYFLPLRITLPSQTEEGPLRMRMSMDNVSRELVSALRSLPSPPSVDVELVAGLQTDVVLASWPQFLLVNVQYDANEIVGELVLEMLVHEPFPAGTFTPSEFPGLF